MRYIVAKQARAVDVGIRIAGHHTDPTTVILNEKEVMFNKQLASLPTLDEKVEALEGSIHSLSEIKLILQNYE